MYIYFVVKFPYTSADKFTSRLATVIFKSKIFIKNSISCKMATLSLYDNLIYVSKLNNNEIYRKHMMSRINLAKITTNTFLNHLKGKRCLLFMTCH